MSPLNRIKTAKILSGFLFWLPIIVLYFKYQGLTDSQAFTLIAFYSLSVSLLEFPTGVIGDYYSHAFSTKLGYFLLALSLIALGFQSSLPVLYLIQFISALGMAFSSGSDTAFLTQYSDDIKRDIKQTRIGIQIVVLLSLPIGSLLYIYTPWLPVVLTGIVTIVSFLLILNIPDKLASISTYTGSIFQKARDGFHVIINNKSLMLVVFISTIILGFETSFKYIYNDLFVKLGLDIEYHGIVMSLFVLLQTLGISQYKSSASRRNRYSLIILPLLICISAFSRNLFFTIFLIATTNFARGLIDVYLDLALLDETPKENMASVLSFKSFLQRLVSSAYIVSYGYILGIANVFIALFSVSVMLGISSLIFIFKYYGNK